MNIDEYIWVGQSDFLGDYNEKQEKKLDILFKKKNFPSIRVNIFKLFHEIQDYVYWKYLRNQYNRHRKFLSEVLENY